MEILQNGPLYGGPAIKSIQEQHTIHLSIAANNQVEKVPVK